MLSKMPNILWVRTSPQAGFPGRIPDGSYVRSMRCHGLPDRNNISCRIGVSVMNNATLAGPFPNRQRQRLDRFATFAKFAARQGFRRPADWIALISPTFFSAKPEKSAREGFPIWCADRLTAVKWRNWKLHFYQQDTMFFPAVKLGIPFIINLYMC
jgi:hypothetical protein